MRKTIKKEENKEIKRRGRPRKEMNNMKEEKENIEERDFVEESVKGLHEIAKKIRDTKEGICIAIYVPKPTFEDYKKWSKEKGRVDVSALIASNTNTAAAEIALHVMDDIKHDLYKADPMLALKRMIDEVMAQKENNKEEEEDEDELKW
jgi:hypothetical protein